MLSKKDFINLLSNAPVSAVDLIISNDSGQILLGRRENSPAKGKLFVPGGRVFKNEKLISAIIRVAKNELSIDIAPQRIKLNGVYEHFYDDSYFNELDMSSHYILSVFNFVINKSEIALLSPDSQHSELLFLTEKQILSSDDVHYYTKQYFTSDAKNCVKCI